MKMKISIQSLLFCIFTGIACADMCDTNYINSVFGPQKDTNLVAGFNALVTRSFSGNGIEAINEFLVDAVYYNCFENVKILLDAGADPNTIQTAGGCTILTVNFMRFQDAQAIEEEAERLATLSRVRQIRDLLVEKGGHFDMSLYLRRDFSDRFSAFMSQQTGKVVYVYCNDTRIQFYDQAVCQEFQVPQDPVNLMSWVDSIFPEIEEWIDGRDWTDTRVVILGPESISWTTLGRVSLPFKVRNIPNSQYMLPSCVPCDPSVLVNIYQANSGNPDAMLEQMDVDCPSGPIVPFLISVEEYMNM